MDAKVTMSDAAQLGQKMKWGQILAREKLAMQAGIPVLILGGTLQVRTYIL